MAGEVEVPSDWAAQVREWGADFVAEAHGPAGLWSSFDFADDLSEGVTSSLSQMLPPASVGDSDYVRGGQIVLCSLAPFHTFSVAGSILPVPDRVVHVTSCLPVGR